jgi:hypothetical protein
VLDLECPFGAGRHDTAHRWEAGLNEAARMSGIARRASQLAGELGA